MIKEERTIYSIKAPSSPMNGAPASVKCVLCPGGQLHTHFDVKMLGFKVKFEEN